MADGTVSDPQPVEERDEQGRALRIGELRDGLFHGTLTAYGEGGLPVLRARLRADRMHGEVRHYDADGALVQVAEYADGVQHGLTTFYAHARPTCRMTYRAGLLDGPSVFFHETGTVAAVFQYSAGKREGEALFHSPQGRPMRRETYANDRLHGPVLGYYDDGTVSERSAFLDGLQDGVLRRYFPSGALMQHGVYRRGLLIEPLRTYSEDGKEIAVLQPPAA